MADKYILSPEVAEEAFKAQLAHTASLIQSQLTTHYHPTDDCGDYLMAALELSATLAGARSNSPDDLVDCLFTLAAVDPDNNLPSEPSTTLYMSYACDGISPAVVDIIEKISGIEF